MTRLYTCPTCGLITNEHYCDAHKADPNAHRSPNRDRSAQKRFREAVLARDQYRCQICGSTADLIAAHTKPLRDFAIGDPAAYDPANGRCLCERCDVATDPYARPSVKTKPRSDEIGRVVVPASDVVARRDRRLF